MKARKAQIDKIRILQHEVKGDLPMAHLLKHSTYFVTDASLEMQLVRATGKAADGKGSSGDVGAVSAAAGSSTRDSNSEGDTLMASPRRGASLWYGSTAVLWRTSCLLSVYLRHCQVAARAPTPSGLNASAAARLWGGGWFWWPVGRWPAHAARFET